MTSAPAAQQLHPRVKYNDRDYDFNELPRNAQRLLQDMVRIDQQIGQLQFELRHLQAARQVYGSSLQQAMQDGELPAEPAGGDGHQFDAA